MVYLGGKSRIAAKIVEKILAATPHRKVYLEPFVGGGAVFELAAPHFRLALASDLQPDLIAMWQALQTGWDPPYVTREKYYELKDSPVSADRGFAMFGCSYSGKAWGGYSAKNSKGCDYVECSRNRVRKLRGLGQFTCVSFERWTPIMRPGVVVYCDPPYVGTTAYTTSAGDFWPVFEQWSKAGASVFVSEYAAPVEWREIGSWSITLKTEGRGHGELRTERLLTR